MKILPITNADYGHNINFKNTSYGIKVANNTQTKAKEVLLTVYGTVFTGATIFDVVKEYLARFLETNEPIERDSNIRYLDTDSIVQQEMLMDLEDVVGREITQEEANNMTTVQDIVYFLDQNCGLNQQEKKGTDVNNLPTNSLADKKTDIENIKQRMKDELEKNNEKYKKTTYDQKENINGMLYHINSECGLNVALKMINNPALLDTDSCYISVNEFFKKISENEERAQVASDVIDKILSKPELFEKEHFKNAIQTILNGTTNNYKKDFVFKLLDNPALFDKDYFVGNLAGIIRFFPKSESDEAIKTRKGVYKILERVNSYLDDDVLSDFFDDWVDELTDYYCELHWSIERDFPDPGEQEEWERKCRELWD